MNIYIVKNIDKYDKECGVIVFLFNFEEVFDIVIQLKLDCFYFDMDSSDILIIFYIEKEVLVESIFDWVIGYN